MFKLSSELSKCGSTVLHSGNSKDNSLYVNVFITSLAELPGLARDNCRYNRAQVLHGYYIYLSLCFPSATRPPSVCHFDNSVTVWSWRVCYRNHNSGQLLYPRDISDIHEDNQKGVASSMGRIGGMVCPLVAMALVSACHLSGAVILFEVVFVLAIASTLLFPFETKGQQYIERQCGCIGFINWVVSTFDYLLAL